MSIVNMIHSVNERTHAMSLSFEKPNNIWQCSARCYSDGLWDRFEWGEIYHVISLKGLTCLNAKDCYVSCKKDIH